MAVVGAPLCSQALNFEQASQELSAQAGKGLRVGCIERANARLPEGIREVAAQAQIQWLQQG